MKNGADANSANSDGETALHLVARSGNIAAANLLLKAGAKIDARENLGQQTPLMWAVARRQPAMVELLISKGADINAHGAIRDYQRVATAESRAKQMDRGGLTPLMYAARENCRECVEILLKHKVDVDLPDPSGVSPLVIAMINNNWDIAKRLVEAGADVNQWDMYGQSPLATAIGGMGGGGGRGGNPLDSDTPNKATGRELVQMLIDRGANPNQQTYFRPARGAGGGGSRHHAIHGGGELGQHRSGQAAVAEGCQSQAGDLQRGRASSHGRAGAWRWWVVSAVAMTARMCPPPADLVPQSPGHRRPRQRPLLLVAPLVAPPLPAALLLRVDPAVADHHRVAVVAEAAPVVAVAVLPAPAAASVAATTRRSN